MWPLCHQHCQHGLLPGKQKRQETGTASKKGNKGRCLLEWLHSVSSAHRGKTGSMSLLGLLICSCCCCGTTGDTHSSSNYCHLFIHSFLGVSLHQCLRGFTSVLQHWWMPSRDTGAITEMARVRLLTIGESCLLPQRSWYWQRHPACQIQASGWPTLSHFYWRPGGKRLISHASLKVMWFEMQYHINQSLNVTVPIPAAFTQAEGGAAAILARCVHEFMCNGMFFFIWVLHEFIFVQHVFIQTYAGLHVYACLNHMAVY